MYPALNSPRLEKQSTVKWCICGRSQDAIAEHGRQLCKCFTPWHVLMTPLGDSLFLETTIFFIVHFRIYIVYIHIKLHCTLHERQYWKWHIRGTLIGTQTARANFPTQMSQWVYVDSLHWQTENSLVWKWLQCELCFIYRYILLKG